jgi:single-strand DNA-binding protein
MNHCSIVGNLTADPQHRTTQGGVSVCSFTVAVNRRGAKDGQPQADFFRVTAWRGLADNCAKWLIKGKKVSVTGSISASAYMGRDNQPHASLDLNADDVEFLSPANTTDQPNPHPHSTPPAPKADASGFVQVGEEDLPF